MTTKEHGHPGQGEPRSHGRTHHENFDIDLNEASEQELAAPNGRSGPPVRELGRREEVPGFSTGMVDDLKSGGARIGSKS